ncbi:MAG: glycoside hydrolase family 3 C-terminal domain-containing protein [Butyrivibrio sp.]|nr:glycoside hydrolase family 3 C-terminal domain-containing protein [Butyrivibrio sp.]
MLNIRFFSNENGPTIGVNTAQVVEKDGLYFKDLEGTGELLPYEDWRLTAKQRATDLASRLTIEEIAGLMMYSPHQVVEEPELTDQQRSFLSKDHLRHVLAMWLKDGETAAKWNNELQAFCETMPHCIPVNISSDPRHGAGAAAAEFKSEAKGTSKWPMGLGLAALFSTEDVKKFARIAAREYRALGIATELGPQIDLGTEPRWMRIPDTYGTDPDLVTAYGKAYCEGLQEDDGTGSQRVNAMVKHWPGGGPVESGRDAHYPFGKFAVYPGDNLKQHMKPFTEGAFELEGGEKASAVMPYYTISCNVDPSGKNVGNSYSKYLIKDVLRGEYGFDGVICTDWGITQDPLPEIDSFSPRCYGMEDLSEAERHLQIIEAGVDQFGGNSNIEPILEAYRLGCEKHGEAAMRKRFEESAKRLLVNIFSCGLFENPYLNPEESVRILGCKEFVDAGFDAQCRSIVMVKNSVLPISERKKVYIPGRHIGAHKGFMRNPVDAVDIPGADKEAVSKFFDVVDKPEDADFAICFMESPISDGYTKETGYRPITLQYRPYKAEYARAESIGQGDFREADNPNRSYLGKSNTAANERDLDNVIETKKIMGDKPVIVSIRVNNPCVFAEFEKYADAILVNFGVETKAVLSVINGSVDPSGLLPVVMPKDMEVVEKHCEDVPFDYEAYTDSVGNKYDYGFGLSFEGVIKDGRH